MRTNEREEAPCFNEKLVARLRAAIPSDEEAADVCHLFGMLADPTRLKILHALTRADEVCVCDLAHALGTTVSNASHHLRKLRDLGILSHRTEGKWVYYSLRSAFAAKLVQRALAKAA